MNDTALVLLVFIATAALVLAAFAFYSAHVTAGNVINLRSYIEQLDRRTQSAPRPQDTPLDPDVWETEAD